ATGEQLNVERTLDVGLLTVRVEHAETGEEARRLVYTDLVVVEGRVVVDVLVAVDQAVIRDDLDAGLGGVVELVAQRGSIDRRDDQDLGALGDHVADLLHLLGDLVVTVLEVDLVAELLEVGLDGVAVLDPTLGGLRRHRDADERSLVVARAGVAAAATATAGAGSHRGDDSTRGEYRE